MRRVLTNNPQLVPEDSACIEGFYIKSQRIPMNHRDLCKYASAYDIGYQRVAGHIRHLVESLTKGVKACQYYFATIETIAD